MKLEASVISKTSLLSTALVGGLLCQIALIGCTNKETSANYPRNPAAEAELTIPQILATNQSAAKFSYSIPYYGFANTSTAYMRQLLSKYCSITTDGSRIRMAVSQGNYADPGMEAAADKLDMIYEEQESLLAYQRQHGIIQKDDKDKEAAPSIIAYSAIMRMHNGSNSMTTEEMQREGLAVKSKEQLKNPSIPGHDYRTHQFMKTLCGEYRDRPTMIEAKIKWINNMHVLTSAPPPTFNPTANPWKNLNGQNFTKYLVMSDQVWMLKKEILIATNRLYTAEAALSPALQAKLQAELKEIEDKIKPIMAEMEQIRAQTDPIENLIYPLEDKLWELERKTPAPVAEINEVKAQIEALEKRLEPLNQRLQVLANELDPLYQAQEEKTLELSSPFRNAFELAIPGQSVCETKYMIASLVYDQPPFKDYNKSFKRTDGEGGTVDFREYIAGYREFRRGRTGGVPNCTKDDLDHIYDFRGDANFKPQTPESNGMIWHAQTITKQCANYRQAKRSKTDPSVTTIPNEVCQAYFEKPFASRYMAARSGLATWLFRKGPGFNESTFEDDYSEEKGAMWILPNVRSFTDPRLLNLGAVPRHYQDREDVPESFASLDAINKFLPLNMGRGDLGFNDLFRLDGKRRSVTEARPAWRRLRDAVNRHTDWYASGYNDGLPDGMMRGQAYSPFVASSYEMSKSDAFVAAGYTVPGVGDFRRHWMYVFKVKRSNWYRQLDLLRGKKINFDRHWLDETTLGTNHLAKEERAFDRLGSPAEKEFDTIIYLHNLVYQEAPRMVEVEVDSVEVVNGQEQTKKVKVWKVDPGNPYSDGEVIGNFTLQPPDPTVDKMQIAR